MTTKQLNFYENNLIVIYSINVYRYPLVYATSITEDKDVNPF